MQVNAPINRYGHQDTNSDKGYGRTSAKFHKPRSFIQYPEPPDRDEAAEAAIDDDTYVSVLKKLLSYTPMDPYAKNKTDPFHFVDGATKMSEMSTARGMVPFPRMYKNKQAVSGGTAPRSPAGPTVTFRTRIRPTGTKRGFSKAPYPQPALSDSEPAKTFDDVINTDLDQKHVDMIKKMVNLIHLEQEQQKVSSRSDIYK